MSSDGPIVIARDLARYYEVSQGAFKPAAVVRALNGVAFSLFAGRTLAVVGESGCGKSTLARQVTMIEAPSAGTLSIDGVEITRASQAQLKALRSRVQMVFQNPYASLNPRKTVADAVGEPVLINTSLTRSERAERVAAMLAKVGLRAEHGARYPHMFSGGQRQRVAIARAMILNPAVVVADEPVSALDVSIQAQILNLFTDLQAEFGTAYMFISHNLTVVQYIAHDLMVMYLGAAVETGSAETIFARPLHPYTQALMSATPGLQADGGVRARTRIIIRGELPSPLHPPPGCTFHQRCPFATARCAIEVPQLRTLDERQVACHYAGELEAKAVA